MVPDPNRADEAFDEQEEDEQLVEIDEHGNVHKVGQAPRPFGQKPTILRDPKGEY